MLQSYFFYKLFSLLYMFKKTAKLSLLGELQICMYFAINFKFVGLYTYNKLLEIV